MSFRASDDIIREAWTHNPRAAFVGFSGGDDSLATAHYCMQVIPDCQVLHINTGIGIEATRDFVRQTCKEFNWPLHEIRAKEDCGQDYDEIVLKYGFPGPSWHRVMYARLKDRAVEKIVRDHKKQRADKIAILTGVRKDESKRRMRYSGREINFRGAQMWVNPLYHYSKTQFMEYIKEHKLRRNPVSEILGMSGECLCGAYAHRGEKALIKIVCPKTAARIELLEQRVKRAGFSWGWEESPPRKKKSSGTKVKNFMPLCLGCEK